MQTKQIIQSSADVIRIVNLVQGNLYKRFDRDYVWLGIVKGIYNDGNNTVIEAIEYRDGWNGMEVQNKIIRGEDDVVIFPGDIEDFKKEFSSTVERLDRKILDAKELISKSENQIDFTNKLISGELQKELSSPHYKSFTQEDYNLKLKEI